MNRIIILGVALILCSSWTVLAQTERNNVREPINNTESSKLSSDNYARIKQNAIAESKALNERMGEELSKPYNSYSNARLIKEYEDFEKQYPTNEDYTSEYKSDVFISSVYYELPLLKDYKKYTDQFAAIIKKIQGPLFSYDVDLKKYKVDTNNLLSTLLTSGVYQSKKSSIVFEYAPIYKARNEEPSILFLNKQIEELKNIIKNGTDPTDINKQLSDMLDGLYDNSTVAPKSQSSEKNPYAKKIANEAKINIETNVTQENDNGKNSDIKPISSSQERMMGGNSSNNNNASPKSDKKPADGSDGEAPKLTNKRVDKKVFEGAYKVFEKQMKDLKKDVDAGKILDTNELRKKLTIIYNTFLQGLEH